MRTRPRERKEGLCQERSSKRRVSGRSSMRRPPIVFGSASHRPFFRRPHPGRPRRTGTGAATTASSFRLSWNSSSLSKSSICSRNGSHNWSTHIRPRFRCASRLDGIVRPPGVQLRDLVCSCALAQAWATALGIRRRAGWAERLAGVGRPKLDSDETAANRPSRRSYRERA